MRVSLLSPDHRRWSYRLEIDMKKFAESVVEFMKEEDGPTAVEYAVMLALIVVACLGSINALAGAVQGNFNTTAGIISGGS